MNSEQSIKDKILSYFNGDLSSAEEKELLKWVKQDSKNRNFFFQVKNDLDIEQIDHQLLTTSYMELRNRLFINQQFKTGKSNKIRGFYWKFSRIAALLFIFITLSFTFSWLMTNFNQKVVWFETSTNRGEKLKLTLPDGSHVWLNSESSLSYPNNFLDGNREIKMTGEAYFEVEKRKGKPFTVKTPAYDIRVLGTKFNVMAYSDFNRTETSLIEGHVQIKKGKQTIDLEPGQMLIYKNKQFAVKRTNTSKSSSWKDYIFDFDQITFQELVIRLEHWYDVDIEIKNPELNQIIYSGVFKNEETLEEVLNTFKMTMPITYTKDDFRKFSIQMNK